MEELITKKYYTIGEVSKKLGEAPSLIRFWEKEFSVLHPDKTEKGTRKFSQQDVEMLKHIHHLVKVKGFTLQGANEHIKQQKDVQTTAEIISKLNEVKLFLETIKRNIN